MSVTGKGSGREGRRGGSWNRAGLARELVLFAGGLGLETQMDDVVECRVGDGPENGMHWAGC